MRRFRNSLLAIAIAAGSCFAQTAEELEAPAVNRVAEKLLCPCGCKINMACRMEPYPCRTCWDNKKKILSMQQSGMSDQAILEKFQQEMGKEVVSVQPGFLGSLSFYAALGFGLILVLVVIRKYSRQDPELAGGPVDDPILDKYHDQIEREVDKLS